MTDPYAQAANQRPAEKFINQTLRGTVHAELAALGGHLVATYGETRSRATHPDAAALATLGGYLLEHYATPPTPAKEAE